MGTLPVILKKTPEMQYKYKVNIRFLKLAHGMCPSFCQKKKKTRNFLQCEKLHVTGNAALTRC
jgi:hypothetical protein